MFAENNYLGCPCGVEGLVARNDHLNAQVVEQVNETQELIMINSFALESDEYQFKKCLQDRISEISSWRWVLDDLAKRLDEEIGMLRYEHKALRVVVKRVKDEIEEHSREGSKPGALSPLSDSVEDAIKEEYNFLRTEKSKFEKMIIELEKQTNFTERIKKRLEDDVYNKIAAITIDETCAKIDLNTLSNPGGKKKKKKYSPMSRWQNRCAALKKNGLQALTNAIVTRQQVRGARVQLSVAAQAYAARVDSALRRRLHANKVKVQELIWQREEATRDLKSLAEEQQSTEIGLLENMEQERVVEARLADRTLRPARELTKDDVDRTLKDELSRLRLYVKNLRNNLERISCLQNHLTDVITNIDTCIEEIVRVVRLDEDRIYFRRGDVQESSPPSSFLETPAPSASSSNDRSEILRSTDSRLNTIKEEDEEEDNDDYPFDN